MQTAFTVNVSSQESIEAGAKAIIEKFGKVEIIVNNAGITRDNLMLRMKPRRLGPGAEHQSDGSFPADAGAAEPDAEESLGTHCEYCQRGGARGTGGPGELRRVEGGTDRVHAIAGARGGFARTLP